jgi:hypothetical protein
MSPQLFIAQLFTSFHTQAKVFKEDLIVCSELLSMDFLLTYREHSLELIELSNTYI